MIECWRFRLDYLSNTLRRVSPNKRIQAINEGYICSSLQLPSCISTTESVIHQQNHLPIIIQHYPPSVIIHHPLSSIHHLPIIIHHSSWSISCLYFSVIRHSSSSILHHLAIIFYHHSPKCIFIFHWNAFPPRTMQRVTPFHWNCQYIVTMTSKVYRT